MRSRRAQRSGDRTAKSLTTSENESSATVQTVDASAFLCEPLADFRIVYKTIIKTTGRAIFSNTSVKHQPKSLHSTQA